MPEYAHYHGSNSCSAILNKHLKDLDFRSHMFRHALIDRMKACNDIPPRLAESMTGHSSGESEFNNYGTVGYTLEQKFEVLKRISIYLEMNKHAILGALRKLDGKSPIH